MDLTIQYIYHSGFMLETKNCALVFDYYKGELKLPDNKKVFVFVSHAHPDHYNPEILKWQDKVDNIDYIISSDLDLSASENIHILDPYEEKEIDSITVKSFGSTDEGISFLVNVDGVNIFHAGDLNWWHWWNDIPVEIEKAEVWFKEEVEKIKGNKIDLAFFPVDPRLEDYYSIGAEYFIKEIQPKYLVPMHFDKWFKGIASFEAKMENSGTRIIQFTENGQIKNLP